MTWNVWPYAHHVIHQIPLNVSVLSPILIKGRSITSVRKIKGSHGFCDV